jgi:tryptophan synthase alpha chain
MTRNRLDETFQQAEAEGHGVLIPYLTAGSPRPDQFVDLAVAVLQAGADMLEIGIPFSDPLLDGPAIQRAQQAALDAGVTPSGCLRFASEISRRSNKPLLFMGAYNPVMAYGMTRFCAEAQAAGVTALIIPDLPLEEQAELRAAANAHDLHLIQLVAPTSTDERMGRVCADASGFLYCISVAGVTGTRTGVAQAARPLVDRARACATVPVAVGFGITTPDDARAVAAFADGVIVGSALVNLVADTPDEERIEVVTGFIESLRGALEGARAQSA